MNSKISQILAEIEKKTEELKLEYSKLIDKYGFSFKNGKIIFGKNEKDKQKAKRNSFWYSLKNTKFREFLSIPFIYVIIIPVLFLDFFLFVYQQTAMRLYGIPLVKRSDYIVFDRNELGYLNGIQKFNCMYCSYVNGVFSFAVEIGGRTEKYWCPIKYANKMRGGHNWQKYFADYGDVDGFKDVFHSTKEFYEEEKK